MYIKVKNMKLLLCYYTVNEKKWDTVEGRGESVLIDVCIAHTIKRHLYIRLRDIYSNSENSIIALAIIELPYACLKALVCQSVSQSVSQLEEEIPLNIL